MRSPLSLNAPQLDPFQSFFMGGFESSTLQFHDLRRVDTIEGSGHDVHCAFDYELLRGQGIRTVRDSLRWHRVERRAGEYDWSEFDAMLVCADKLHMQIVWDLCHFGLPDHVDLFAENFPECFADFAEAAAHRHSAVSDQAPWWCPINEISYWSHAAGTHGFMHPSRPGEAHFIKRQLVRASLLATQRLRAVDERARFIATDPLIHVTTADGAAVRDEEKTEASFEAFDMLIGRSAPELGGARSSVDAIGLNYYPHNQWNSDTGTTLALGMKGYRPLRYLLEDVWNRYRIPIVISETGADDDNGPSWLSHVAGEVAAATRMGVNVIGLCIYPVMDFPSWVDGKQCTTGLIRHAGKARAVCADMARALADATTQRSLDEMLEDLNQQITLSHTEFLMSHSEQKAPESWPNTIAPVAPAHIDEPQEPATSSPDMPVQPAPSTGPATPSVPTLQPADAPMGNAGENEEERLDEALQETMPTSDPISIKIA